MNAAPSFLPLAHPQERYLPPASKPAVNNFLQ
jgi:hypothetical protein